MPSKKKTEPNWALYEQVKNHKLNKNHDKIKWHLSQGMSVKRLREIYGAWAVNEVLNYHE